MKVQIISDTHTNPYELNIEADLIVHLGDISNGNWAYILQFVDKCKAINKPYVLVVGNHDAYFKSYEELYDFLDLHQVNYLKEGKEFKFQNKIFVGGTFFTNFTLNAKNDLDIDLNKDTARYNIYDFIAIRRKDNKFITPEDYVTMHNIQWNWIQKYRNNPDVVVLTHFPPHPAVLSDYWKAEGGALNSYFINTKNLTGFSNWFFGHTHDFVDIIADGCHLICNPLGYPKEHDKNGFVKEFLVNL